MAAPDPNEPFFLIVADLDAGLFCIEGPMTDDRAWRRAAQRAKEAAGGGSTRNKRPTSRFAVADG